MFERFSLVFTEDEMKRIQIPSPNEIRVDIHQLTVKEAQRLLKNLIALDSNDFNLRIVHGYLHGTSLKSMIWNDFSNPRLVKRSSVSGNHGQTILSIAKSA